MRVHLLWGRCCRRGTTAACVFNCAAPDASVARAPAFDRCEFDTNPKQTAIAPEGVHRAPRRVQGGVCDGRTMPAPSHEMKLLAALSALSEQRARGAAGPAISLGRRGAASDLIEKGCPVVVAATQGLPLPYRHQWAGPGSTRRAPARSRRICTMRSIEEKREDDPPRTLKRDAWVVYQTRSYGTSTTRTARRTRGSTPCLSILDPLYDRSCPRSTRGEALLPLAVGGARGRGRRQ